MSTQTLLNIAYKIADLQQEASRDWNKRQTLLEKRKSKKRDAELDALSKRKHTRQTLMLELNNDARAIYRHSPLGCFEAGHEFHGIVERIIERLIERRSSHSFHIGLVA